MSRSNQAFAAAFATSVVTAALLLSVAFADDAPPKVPEIEGHKSWTFHRGPFEVTHGMEFLCFRPPFAGHPGMEPTQGPEFVARSIRVYANDLAATLLGAEAIEPDAEFPAGSVIVKEKVALHGEKAPARLGVMIKREPGFDDKHDDWEFLTRDPDGRFVRGPDDLSGCYSCHQAGSFGGATAVDYVFVGRYRSSEPILEALRELEN